jgi:predicted nuclease with RNAse H fold
MASMTATYGIDLASQPERTAVCMVEWRRGERAYVHCPGDHGDDQDLLAQMAQEYVTKVGIDAPFGWPSEFIEALNANRVDGSWGQWPTELLRLRATDRAVRAETRLTPLSVSTDKIGLVAMRCVRLLDLHRQATGEQPDRSGSGRMVEVYPAAALRQWGLSPKDAIEDPGSYKGRGAMPKARRQRLMTSLVETAGRWLEMNDKTVHVCCESDDCLDALLCALIARAVEIGHVMPITDPGRAADEGWIALPVKGSIPDLNRGP